MIRRFSRIEGRYIKTVYGQYRLAFSHSDSNDLYDLVEWAERGGYPGSVLSFYDFENGSVYTPFEKKRDVLYGDPVYAGGFYYFLQGDYGERKVTLFRFLPPGFIEHVTQFSTDEVSLYNLQIVGVPVHVISQDSVFECYYPERISFPLRPNETVSLIEDGRIYAEAWIEEGWDKENDRASDEYRFYNKVIVKDFEGNTLSEEVGSLFQSQDGTYWIA